MNWQLRQQTTGTGECRGACLRLPPPLPCRCHAPAPAGFAGHEGRSSRLRLTVLRLLQLFANRVLYVCISLA